MDWRDYNSYRQGALIMNDNMHKMVMEAGLREFSEYQLEYLHNMIDKAFKKFDEEVDKEYS